MRGRRAHQVAHPHDVGEFLAFDHEDDVGSGNFRKMIERQEAGWIAEPVPVG